VTERAATRMLVQKLRARNLLETDENSLNFHVCTPIPGSSTRDKSALTRLSPRRAFLLALYGLGAYQDHAS
jgi:hypothetical protein